jgi:hypothetical protein
MQDKSLHAVVTLPESLAGEFRWRGVVKPIRGGKQELVFR